MQEKTTLSRREFLGKTSAGLAAAGVAPRSFSISGNPKALALHGGAPVRSTPFPAWPQTTLIPHRAGARGRKPQL